ncbi:hypothetical protein EG68_04416 [Paragonimus skrjabini miyazakii]|uniref:Androglobin domain-containing protein n=1 Tax=Paragonimus skrjabini miyazakii TaxID=59628 RepID=A0A8S9YVF8_9TREM|nr:hypothetical protein EG68_04416 [Paragonimus skrjabini miyazakii]
MAVYKSFHILKVSYCKFNAFCLYKAETLINGPQAAGSAMERPLQRGQYLFVDSVHPCEVIFHLSAISRWPVPSGKESHLSCSRGISFAPDVEELTIPPSSTEPLKRSAEVADRESRPARSQTDELTNSAILLHPPAPATLVIESFQWLSDHLGQPLKRIDITGCRAISVCLPPGRHCLSIMVYSPLGFHLMVIGALRMLQVDKSSTDRPVIDDKLTDEKFSYPAAREARPISSAKGGQNTRTACNMGSLLVQLGDEDCVLSTGLTQLPQRIRHHADQLVNSLYKLAIATASLSNPDSWPVPTEAPTNICIPSPEQEVDLVISTAITQDPEDEQNQRANLCVAEFYNRRSEVESLLRNNSTSDDYDRTGTLGTRNFRQTLLNLLHHACVEGGGSLGTPEMNLAWRVMQMDLTTENPLCVTYGSIGTSTSAAVAPKPKSKPLSTLSNESRAVSTGRASDKVNPREKPPKPGSSPRQIKSKPPSQPESARLDYTQAHWRIRIIVDASAANEIVLSKPEDRAAEIRMIKKAWEEMEPGRAERAALSRAHYLESQAAKMPTSDPEPLSKDVSDGDFDQKSLSAHSVSTTGEESSSPIVGLEHDPSTVYTLEPPTDLSRTLAPIASPDKTAYQRDCIQVEQERILTAVKTLNAHTDSWFIGTQYLQAYCQLTSDAQDWVCRFDKKQEIFRQLTAEWDAVQAGDRRERIADHKRYTLLLRTVQFLNDKIRAGYHHSCESLRQQLVNEYRKQLELELAASGEDNKPAIPVDSRSQSKQKKKKDKSPGSRSGSGRRTK